MALQDILEAITGQADQQIADARALHQKEVTKLREQSERRTAKQKQETATQKERRKEQMHAKAQTHAAMQKRNAVLTKKQELLDRTYQNVVEKLVSLPDDKVESLLHACLEQITAKGKIHPAKKHEKILKKLAGKNFEVGSTIDAAGGFTFVSKTQEQDFTFEQLVTHILRPKTELKTSEALFGTAA